MSVNFWVVLGVSMTLATVPWLGSVMIRVLFEKRGLRKAYGEECGAESDFRIMLLPQILVLASFLGADAVTLFDPFGMGRGFDWRFIGFVTYGCVIVNGGVLVAMVLLHQFREFLSGVIWTREWDRLSKRSWLGVATAMAYFDLALAAMLFGTSLPTQVAGIVGMILASFSIVVELLFRLNGWHERIEKFQPLGGARPDGLGYYVFPRRGTKIPSGGL